MGVNTMKENAQGLHERLVSHTLAITDELEGRSGVWGEHSYARERGAACHPNVRALLLPRTSTIAASIAPVHVDVETLPPDPPSHPLDSVSDTESCSEDDAPDNPDWEQNVLAAAPNLAHRRLARLTLDLLADMRLRYLAAADRGRWQRVETAREAASKLRRMFAVGWREVAWLHAMLLRFLPRPSRSLYDHALSELARSAPRLAARLTPRSIAANSDPLDSVGRLVSADAPGPWVGWVSVGCERQDLRWTRRLGALLYVRRLPTGPTPASAPPDRWCAARAHAIRAALGQMLQEARDRDRAVVLGGCGAGAAVASRLATAAGVRGAVLLAPPSLTAEGWEECGDARAPLLLVTGGRNCEAAAGGARLLLLAGADSALRLPRRLRLRLRVPQQALDAAIVEECARWAVEVCEEQEESEGSAAQTFAAAPDNRTIEIVEGCVVTRAAGGTPLALGPPRRAPLQAADIMRLPIVFADDLPSSSPAPAQPVEGATAARGTPVRYTRVMVARGAGSRPRRAQPHPS